MDLEHFVQKECVIKLARNSFSSQPQAKYGTDLSKSIIQGIGTEVWCGLIDLVSSLVDCSLWVNICSIGIPQ